MQLPDPQCPTCKGFGLVSVPITEHTAEMATCWCIMRDVLGRVSEDDEGDA